ncbi:hypothetical protein DSM14862_01709 [Sulfitobacter indolifex]|nr:hypothetical protein DSM14862_01709 [Sulfitobacter indolifex]
MFALFGSDGVRWCAADTDAANQCTANLDRQTARLNDQTAVNVAQAAVFRVQVHDQIIRAFATSDCLSA